MGKKNRESSRSFETGVLLSTIENAREKANLSQREVARRLGFHPTVYGKIERGERVLDVVEFVALARALGVDPMALLGAYLAELA